MNIMKKNMNRRDFSKLSVAAFGGMLAGCANEEQPAASAGSSEPVAALPADAGDSVNLLLKDPHVCKGLNQCKGTGACATASNDCAGKNECAGQGGCATAEKHSCHTENACKGQGGCGESAGLNECKGKGECAVPLGGSTWTKVRAKYEKAMTEAGKKFGDAPAAKS
jgi:hypothetical protein